MSRYRRMSERSNSEIVWVFFIFSPVCALLLLVVAVVMVFRSGLPQTFADWCGLAWGVVVLPLGALALPAAGWQELQRRRKESCKPVPPRE